MSGFAKFKRNVEKVICFSLLGVLVCAGLCFLKFDSAFGKKGSIPTDLDIRKKMKESEEYIARRRKSVLSEVKLFIRTIPGKPVFHYSMLVRRNPFAPIAIFKPPIIEGSSPVTDIVLPGDLILLKTPALEEGILKAQIRNLKTGKLYSVKEGDKIGNAVIVKEVTQNGVTIGMDGRGDMILRPPPKPLGEPVLPYVLTGTMTIGGQMVAQIENIVTGESYFPRVGEEIGDNFRVKEIKRDTVILSGAKGKDIVLKLGEIGE